MSKNGDDHSNDRLRPEEYHRIALRVKQHPNWSYRDCGGFGKQVERSITATETGETVEYWFDHLDTTGVLRVEIPSLKSPPAALRGVLSQALEQRQQPNPETDSFLERLVQRHQEIAEQYSGGYVTPIEDSVSIVRVEVPFDYDLDRVDEALTRVSEVSEDVQAFHDEMRKALSGSRE